MGPHLLEQVASLLGRKRLDELLLGRGQNALQADHEKIAEQVGVNILGATAHVVLLEARNAAQTAASISPWVFIPVLPRYVVNGGLPCLTENGLSGA